jgi:aldose 1-epimerase
MTTTAGIQETLYGTLPDGHEVRAFEIVNSQGMRAQVMNYGAILISLETPDRNGLLADVTLGYDSLDSWLANPCYFGATVGRYGNRIANGQFILDGTPYQLSLNEQGVRHLHGGHSGFNCKLWNARVIDSSTVEFSLTSPDGDEGFPGTLHATVCYSLTDDNELIWRATATTDAPTPVNLVHHTYWNLSGNPHSLISDHLLQLDAPSYLPVIDGIPTGEIAPVSGTPMDFSAPHRIGDRIDADFPHLQARGGYDHCWVLSPHYGLRLAGRLSDPQSGRSMEAWTDQPGIQIYAGNFIDGSLPGKNGITYAPRSGVCLETQKFPDSPNQPGFPSCILRPGDVYQHTLIHKFSVSPS